jgi:hypothetical protein
MRLAILSVLLLSVACISKPDEAAVAPLEYKRFEPLMVSPADHSRLRTICNALESKEARLPVLISSAYSFSYAQKACAENEIGEASNVEVTIQRPHSDYIFRQSNGDIFIFPFETSLSGTMVEICANVQDLRSPLQTSSKGAMWFTTFTSTAHCSPGTDSMCVHIQRGEHVNEMNYVIHTNEWITFNVRGSRTGFFSERKLISQADCGPNQIIERRATLK